MNSFRIYSRQNQNLIVAVVFLVATLALALLPMIVGAAQLTERSIALSSSSVSATNVTYEVSFTAENSAEAFVVDFCSNTPLLGETCTAPAGFDASAASSTSTGFTDVSDLTNNTVRVGGTIDADEDPAPVAVAISGITNPNTAGPLYARIVTYESTTDADGYTSQNPDAVGAHIDSGSVAISITPTVGVSGTVLESLTFCVAGGTDPIGENCTGIDPVEDAPILELGEEVGDVIALTTDVSEGTINTQISTNAASGAVVRLKSSAVGCGGLIRAGAPTACDILPALNDGIAAGQARFGVRTSTATDAGTGANGVLQPFSGSFYNNSTFALNYVNGDATGVTSTYGDPFLDTDGAPVNNKNMALTFGAAVSNNTPAGLYSADLNLIATGRF